MAKLKVYYNGACPVCDAGIKGQRNRMGACSTDIDWIDIDRDADAVSEIGADREFVRERLHLRDENGKLVVGADAFEALWSRTPSQEWLARAMRLPGLNRIAAWFYNAFAAVLYRWNRFRRRW